MFETAELGRKIDKEEFKTLEPILRENLLSQQVQLRQKRDCSVVVVFAGVDGAGKGESVSLLNAWMDPRWIITRAYDTLDESERQRPEFWQYWRDLPPRGRIGFFLSAWYSRPILDRVYGRIDEEAFLKSLERIVNFERALARDGTLIVKFWMHLSRKAQEKRLRSLEKDPLTKARVSERDWENWQAYDRFIDAAERVITRTNRGIAPWNIIEGADHYYRSVRVATLLHERLQKHLQDWTSQNDVNDNMLVSVEEPVEENDAAVSDKMAVEEPGKTLQKDKEEKVKPINIPHPMTILQHLDMKQVLKKKNYRDQLNEQQARLHRLHLIAREKGISSLLVFEGPDAAGKGGAIRRVNEALEARNYQVHGIAAPSEEEREQHYLWRFWRHLSPPGRVTIFDRSWYGRVLVERIEGFAREDEWRRAYGEINDFEEQLVEHGIVLIKYWLHITKDEQLVRFKEREKTPHKRWKLTDEDWRNREKWEDYEQAVDDMVQYTSSAIAPWTLVEGNDKRFARVKVLTTFCDRLEKAIE